MMAFIACINIQIDIVQFTPQVTHTGEGLTLDRSAKGIPVRLHVLADVCKNGLQSLRYSRAAVEDGMLDLFGLVELRNGTFGIRGQRLRKARREGLVKSLPTLKFVPGVEMRHSKHVKLLGIKRSTGGTLLQKLNGVSVFLFLIARFG